MLRAAVSSLRKEGEKEVEAEMKIEEESTLEKPEEPKVFQRTEPTIPVIGKEPEAISISFEDDETEKKSVEEPISEPIIEESNEENRIEVVIEKPKVEEIEQKPTTAEDLVAKHGVYDHKLDLANFQLPNLDLLKDYGSE